MPREVHDRLAELGAFGIKIPQEYGGLGLSQRTYNRAIAHGRARSSAIGVLLSAHQSIGVPQPLKMFGTPEQKKKYLPRLAKPARSPASRSPNRRREATRRAWLRGRADARTAPEYILNGEKLWCTNGPIAELHGRHGAHAGAEAGGSGPASPRSSWRCDWEGVETDAPLHVHGAARHRERRGALHERARPRREPCSGARGAG
jgi:alkylation response protein AidB-like acyl-CoA dehydrogenase